MVKVRMPEQTADQMVEQIEALEVVIKWLAELQMEDTNDRVGMQAWHVRAALVPLAYKLKGAMNDAIDETARMLELS